MLIVISVNDTSKIVSLWFANDDPPTESLPEEIRKICDDYRKRKYMIAIFRSGKENLFGNTFALLKHNRQLAAEKEVRQAKLAGSQ